MNKNLIDNIDLLFFKAAKNIVNHQKASIEFLENKLNVDKTRASNILDQLIEEGIVAPYHDDHGTHKVVIENEGQLDTLLKILFQEIYFSIQPSIYI